MLIGLDGVVSDSFAAADDVDMFNEERPKERLTVDANATGEGARFMDVLESARMGVVLLEVLAARLEVLLGADTNADFLALPEMLHLLDLLPQLVLSPPTLV